MYIYIYIYMCVYIYKKDSVFNYFINIMYVYKKL